MAEISRFSGFSSKNFYLFLNFGANVEGKKWENGEKRRYLRNWLRNQDDEILR